MGLDDEGTPPATHGGLLAEHFDSPSYSSARRASRENLQYGQPKSIKGQQNYNPKVYLLPRNNSFVGLDLVKLIEENWFWRSTTASPSLAQAVSYHSSANHSSPRYRHEESLGVLEPQSSQTSNTQIISNSQALRAVSGLSNPKINGQDVLTSSVEHSATARQSQSAGVEDTEIVACSDGESRAQLCAERAGPVPRYRDQIDRQDPTLGDPLGTWAHRVFRFRPDHKLSAPKHIPGTPDVDDQIATRIAKSREEGQPEAAPDQEASGSLEAAWRWRFNRRWQIEQAKQLDPDHGLDGEDEDGWDSALGYLDACGPGLNLQIARTTSIENNNLGASSVKSVNSDLSTFSLEESHRDKRNLKAEADMDATKSIVSVAKKAQLLRNKQQEIEKDAQQRWGRTRLSMSWAGQYLAGAIVDEYGLFEFVLVKVCDRTSAHRLLVRGRNNCCKGDLVKALQEEVRKVCRDHKLPPVTVLLLGSGVMEWSRERDRRIIVSSGHVERDGDPNIHTSDDVVRLAGALTRASLGAPNRVCINGEKLS